MKSYKLIVVLVITIIGYGQMFAQSSNTIAPDWIKGYFRELNNSYIEVVSASAADRDAARNKAAQVIVERRNLATGQRVNVRVSGGNVIVDGESELTVKARVIDEYAEHVSSGQWVVYLLVQTCKHPNLTYEPVTVSGRYPFSVRALIPGMVQIEKGQTGKGIAFIGSELVFVGGIIAFEGLRSTYTNKIGSTHNATQRICYADKANTFATMRNFSIAGAAVVFVWSFVDALSSKGPNRVILGDASLTVTPYADMESMGLAMNIRF